MHKDVKITENPITGKILIGSAFGDMTPAVKVATDFLNASCNKEQDIEYHCDFGATVITFPKDKRKESYTEQELLAIIQSNRGEKIEAPFTPEA